MRIVRNYHLRTDLLCVRLAFLALVALVVLPAMANQAKNSPQVEMTGGADFSGHAYAWTITNHHTSPIVHLSMPGHHVDLFTVPNGWTFQRTESGFNATAESGAGIAPRREQVFKMRVSDKGAKRNIGSVTARFDDGTEFVVRNVEVPSPEDNSEAYMPLIGLGLMMIVIVAAKRRRARAKTATTSH